MTKRRADQALVDAGLAPSRTKAQALIMAGQVHTNQGRKIDKAGTLLREGEEVQVKGQGPRYVSRGGDKLHAALHDLRVEVSGNICLDAGASTGGFTDCLLQHGAAKVYAVDVGYGQLAWSLQQHTSVVVMDRTNIRELTPEHLGEQVDLAVADLSFISLAKVLPAISGCLAPTAGLVFLVKPQFEVGPEGVGKGGIVRDPSLREGALAQVARSLKEAGFEVRGHIESPIRGAKGNVEYLIHATRG